MNTDELISMLSTGVTAVDRGEFARRLGLALGWAVVGSLLSMLLLLGVQPGLQQLVAVPMFWGKLGFAAALVAAGVLATARLSRPGARLSPVWIAVSAPVLLLWAGAAYQLIQAGPLERSALVFGQTWLECLVNISVLSLPAFAAVLWAMKGLAPTRLRLAGAAAGMLSGSVGALVYALHCPELAAPFLAIWYVLGIVLTTMAGALVGPRALRW